MEVVRGAELIVWHVGGGIGPKVAAASAICHPYGNRQPTHAVSAQLVGYAFDSKASCWSQDLLLALKLLARELQNPKGEALLCPGKLSRQIVPAN
jgi:hypothetical protein